MLSVFAICLGACVGALSRWGLGLWLNPVGVAAGSVLPMGTLAANIGGYLIGVCVAVFQALPQLDRRGDWHSLPAFWVR